jgi:hypothetical protein
MAGSDELDVEKRKSPWDATYTGDGFILDDLSLQDFDFW